MAKRMHPLVRQAIIALGKFEMACDWCSESEAGSQAMAAWREGAKAKHKALAALQARFPKDWRAKLLAVD